MLNKTLIAIGGRPASGKSRLLAQLAQTGVYGVVQVDDISAHLWKINGARYFDLLGLSPCPGRTIRRRLLDRPDLRHTLREEMLHPTMEHLRARIEQAPHESVVVEWGGILWARDAGIPWSREIWVYRDEADRISADISRENAKPDQGPPWTREESVAWADLTSPKEFLCGSS